MWLYISKYHQWLLLPKRFDINARVVLERNYLLPNSKQLVQLILEKLIEIVSSRIVIYLPSCKLWKCSHTFDLDKYTTTQASQKWQEIPRAETSKPLLLRSLECQTSYLFLPDAYTLASYIAVSMPRKGVNAQINFIFIYNRHATCTMFALYC